MSDLKNLDDHELEGASGGYTTWNSDTEAWEAVDDFDASCNGSFPGDYDDRYARGAAQQRAMSLGDSPRELGYPQVQQLRKRHKSG